MRNSYLILLVFFGIFFINACTTTGDHSSDLSLPKLNNKEDSIDIFIKERRNRNEVPVAIIQSNRNSKDAAECLKTTMLSKLKIPNNFLNFKNTKNHIYEVVLQNPFSNTEGLYYITKPNKNYSTIEMYSNGLLHISKVWRDLPSKCS